MDQRKFSSLSIKEKLRWLYFKGEHLTAIRYYQYKVILYLSGSFLVEVFYHNNHGEIEKVEVLSKNSSRLKFYADQIKLTSPLMP